MATHGRRVERPQSSIWKKFEEIEGGSKGEKMRRVHCLALISRRPARMHKYFDNCSARPGPSCPKAERKCETESEESVESDSLAGMSHELELELEWTQSERGNLTWPPVTRSPICKILDIRFVSSDGLMKLRVSKHFVKNVGCGATSNVFEGRGT